MLKQWAPHIAPHMEAWIETQWLIPSCCYNYVAPCTGAWIETAIKRQAAITDEVAPRTGTWIETVPHSVLVIPCPVAPCTGAWIKTKNVSPTMLFFWSPHTPEPRHTKPSMAKMAHTCKHHSNATLIGGIDNFLVTHATTRLNDAACTCIGNDI